MPSAAPESLRERRMAPPCAPGPRLRHATSWEVLLGSSHAFSTVSAAPFTDVESTRIGSSDRASGSLSSFLERPVAASVTVSTTESARGQMCRELHEPFLLRIDFPRNTKSSETMLFFIHLLPTGLSTACPRERAPFPVFQGFPSSRGIGEECTAQRRLAID